MHESGCSGVRFPLEFRALCREVREAVDLRLAAIWSEELERLTPLGAAAHWPAEAARDLCLRGGKRLRAALVAAGYCVGRWAEEEEKASDWKPALAAAVAVELLQSYFLIHDDWMDEDEVRRGGPAVHSELTRRFGSSELGARGGILAGDYTVALAGRELSKGLGEAAAEVQACFARMQIDAVTGQQLDVLSLDADPETVYRLKTGSYSVAGPLELGLRVAGVPSGELAWVSDFAIPLGIAFQLRDDLLGLYGEPEVTGKPSASDLLSGKRSYTIVHALSSLDGAAEREFRAAWGRPQATPAAIELALGHIDSCGARAHTEQRIEHWVEASREALRAHQHSGPARTLLGGVAEALTQRFN